MYRAPRCCCFLATVRSVEIVWVCLRQALVKPVHIPSSAINKHEPPAQAGLLVSSTLCAWVFLIPTPHSPSWPPLTCSYQRSPPTKRNHANLHILVLFVLIYFTLRVKPLAADTLRLSLVCLLGAGGTAVATRMRHTETRSRRQQHRQKMKKSKPDPRREGHDRRLRAMGM